MPQRQTSNTSSYFDTNPPGTVRSPITTVDAGKRRRPRHDSGERTPSRGPGGEAVQDFLPRKEDRRSGGPFFSATRPISVAAGVYPRVARSGADDGLQSPWSSPGLAKVTPEDAEGDPTSMYVLLDRRYSSFASFFGNCLENTWCVYILLLCIG